MITESIIKLLVALLLGLLIGIDRQLKQKPLGLKTTMIIAIASCLMTVVSIESFERFTATVFNDSQSIRMDPMRLAAQIVSGIGFLGAGVILQRKNDVISGLTSAALIWAASALGITVGVGLYLEAFFATVLFIVSVNIVPKWIKRMGPKRLKKRDVSVTLMVHTNSKMTDLLKAIDGSVKTEGSFIELVIRELKIKDIDNDKQQIDLLLSSTEKVYTTEIYYFFKKMEDVLRVEIERL